MTTNVTSRRRHFDAPPSCKYRINSQLLYCGAGQAVTQKPVAQHHNDPQREDKMTTRGTDAADATTTKPTEDQYANPAHKPWPLTKETTLRTQGRGRQRRRRGSHLGVSETKTTPKRQDNKDLAFSFSLLFTTKMTYFVKNTRKYSFFLRINRFLRLKHVEQQAGLARVFALFLGHKKSAKKNRQQQAINPSQDNISQTSYTYDDDSNCTTS